MLETRSLLTQVVKLEEDLHRFAFEQLNTKAAKELRSAFEQFKDQLDKKVFGEETTPESGLKKTSKKPVAQQREKEEYGIIANVSHEIRTPLNGIIGFLDLLKETKMTKNQWELVRALGSASDNLLDRTNALLDYSKIASGNETFSKVNFNLKNLIDEVAFLCKTLITNDAVAFNFHIEADVPAQVKGDPSKLSQILLNLLGNAIKFVEEGIIELHVSLQENHEQLSFLEFKVTDTGIGIPNDKLKQIFETYQQAAEDTHIRYGGTGLGLSIVKELVQKMDGKISVNSELGVGSCFNVLLPFEKGNSLQSDAKRAIELTPATTNYKELAGKKILVFEDNVLNQKLMQNRLSSWKCDVFVTADGTYGIELLQKQDFDLVLMDLKMPKMNGFEISQRIRRHKTPSINSIPIIAISADFSVRDKEQCDRYEINDFILKPYNAENLYQLLVKNSKNNTAPAMDSTKSAAVISTTDGVNLRRIFEECLEQYDLLVELVQLFKQNILEFVGKSKTHLQANNLQGVGFAAHKIKSSLAMLDATVLHEICTDLHEACKTGSSKRVQKLYDQFLMAYPPIEAAIDTQLKEFKKN